MCGANTNPILILKNGESNSMGYAKNSEASTSEQTSTLQLLNNKTLQFENWNINNSIRGCVPTGDNPGGYHGWDLEISNLWKSGYFGDRKVYVVKAGLNGYDIANIAHGTPAYTNLLARVNAAKSLIGDCDMVMFYSQGINDFRHGGASHATSWKAQTKNYFNQIRYDIGALPIYMTLFESPMTSAIAPFNNAINEIATELPDVTAISTANLATDDAWHWSYSSMKIIANRMVTAYFNY